MKIQEDNKDLIKSLLVNCNVDSLADEELFNLFINEFSKINSAEHHGKTEKQKEENYRLLAFVVSDLKSRILIDKKHYKPINPNLRKFGAIFFLCLGCVIAPLNGSGVATGILSFLPFVLPLPAQVVIYITFATIYFVVFIGFDFAKISEAFKTSFFRIVRLTDNYLNTLEDIDKAMDHYYTDAFKCRRLEDVASDNNILLLYKAFVEIEKGYEERKVNLTKKSRGRSLVELIACIFAGVGLMCGTCLGVKGGALIFTGILASFVTLSGPAIWAIVGVLVGCGVVLGLGGYLVLQRKGLSDLIARIWGTDVSKFDKIHEKIKSLKRCFNQERCVTSVLQSSSLARRIPSAQNLSLFSLEPIRPSSSPDITGGVNSPLAPIEQKNG